MSAATADSEDTFRLVHQSGTENTGVTPQVLITIISAYDLVNQVKHVDFGQTLVNPGHHLENLANIH
jgi:hypothetical protein